MKSCAKCHAGTLITDSCDGKKTTSLIQKKLPFSPWKGLKIVDTAEDAKRVLASEQELFSGAEFRVVKKIVSLETVLTK